MDPIANIAEQLELAQAIIAKFDAAEDGLLSETEYQAEELARLVLALDEWRKKGGFDPYSQLKTFQTSDGYQFFFIGGKWIDSRDPDNHDMLYEPDAAGHPIDDQGKRLEGKYV